MPKLKLQPELEFVCGKFQPHLPAIRNYADVLRRTGEYRNFEIRLAWDCLRVYIGIGTITSWYEKHACTDKHITTLGIHALRRLGVL